MKIAINGQRYLNLSYDRKLSVVRREIECFDKDGNIDREKAVVVESNSDIGRDYIASKFMPLICENDDDYDKDWRIASPEEIFEFAEEKLGFKHLDIQTHPSNKKYLEGANILHEIGHAACEKDSRFYQVAFDLQDEDINKLSPRRAINKTIKKGYEVNRFKLRTHEGEWYISAYFDPQWLPIFPNEWGVQEWCRQVARKNKWLNCLGRTWDWQRGDYFVREKLYGDDLTSTQLRCCGIDIMNNVYISPIEKISYKQGRFDFYDKSRKKKLINSCNVYDMFKDIENCQIFPGLVKRGV